MRADHELGVGILRIEFEHAFVIATGSNGVAQGGKPGALDEPGIERELGASDAAGVEDVDVVRMLIEFGVFDLFSLLNELLNALFLCGISRAVGLADKTVVGVFAGVDGAHAIELAYEER